MTDTSPVTRPATAMGWSPPFTDTPDEIAARRAAAGDACQWRREQAAKERIESEAWAEAIAAGLAELRGAA